MKTTFLSWVQAICGVAILALFVVPLPAKLDKIGIDKIASAPSPACDCNPCKCVVCKCEPEATALVVGPPPDIADTRPTITPAEARAVEQVAFTQPQILPVKPPPQPQVLPVKPKAAPVAGHYEYRQQCNGRSCSMVRVWVPHQPAKQAAPVVYQQPVQYGGSCGPGGCGRLGIFGRRR
jgi:hypothetical protein